jgi:hypothetical protein
VIDFYALHIRTIDAYRVVLNFCRSVYILRQYSVSKSYSLKLSVTKLYREYIPSCVMLLPFKVSTTSWLIIV